MKKSGVAHRVMRDLSCRTKTRILGRPYGCTTICSSAAKGDGLSDQEVRLDECPATVLLLDGPQYCQTIP